MKRKAFEKYLASHDSFLLSQGRSHSIFANSKNNHKSPLPRHNEINNYTVKKICSDLQIEAPKAF